jgi:UDP-galactopyranose mutase
VASIGHVPADSGRADDSSRLRRGTKIDISRREELVVKRALADSADLVCLSHLRWNFVFQRPQHLMSRAARTRRVFFVEEPVLDADAPSMTVTIQDGVHVVVPHLPPGTGEASSRTLQRHLLRRLLHGYDVAAPMLWFYTPMALKLVEGISPSLVVYDCMDELSGFAGASPELRDRERDLLRLADVVFTGGHRLYEAKRELHPFVRPFPSSVDVAHFAR